MSAFMFRIHPDKLAVLSDDKLKEMKEFLEAATAKVEWDKLQQCTFDFDLAYGRRASLNMVEQEIARRATGGDFAIKVPLVPGFNPGATNGT